MNDFSWRDTFLLIFDYSHFISDEEGQMLLTRVDIYQSGQQVLVLDA